MKNFFRALIPTPLLGAYHYVLAMLGALLYGFPSRKLVVVGVTGTKGKSSTTELIAHILRTAGYKTASASTIRFSIGAESERNLFKMTMPGRFFLQKLLRRAVESGCTHAVVEMTSEGALQHRHRGIALDALVFLNLAPEHLERHGGMEAYAQAKLTIAQHLARSSKRPRIIVANQDDAYGQRFLDVAADIKAPFSLREVEPYTADEGGSRFTYKGELFTTTLPGLFNLKNCLAALKVAEALGVSLPDIRRALQEATTLPGRQQRIERGQPFSVIVDNAHTPDSLTALFETFKHRRRIGLIGSMGGGRDTWNRPEKGRIAETYCDVVVISNEDPCDEDPEAILHAIANGCTKKKPLIILDRREAIAAALKAARPGDVVLITGKGTDPYILGPRGSKTPWSDADVAAEELIRLGFGA